MNDAPIIINSQPEAVPTPMEPEGRNFPIKHSQPTDPVNLEIATHPGIAGGAGSADLPTTQLGGTSDMEANRITVEPVGGGENVYDRQNQE